MLDAQKYSVSLFVSLFLVVACSISKVPSPSLMLAADDAPNQYETLHFTEHQALLSLLFHTEVYFHACLNAACYNTAAGKSNA